MEPLRYPDVPDYYQTPSDLEDAFQQAMEARRTAETHLCARTSIVDPSAEQVRAQLLAQIALDCAKIASSLAVCQIADWLEEEEDNVPAFRWRAVKSGRTRQNRRRAPQSGEAED